MQTIKILTCASVLAAALTHRRAEMRRKARRRLHHQMRGLKLTDEQRETLHEKTFEHRQGYD